jgi:hypothetical protein
VVGLVTLAMAKAHLRLPVGTPDDADVQQKIDAASAMVREYLVDNPDAATWDELTVPLPVQMATLVGVSYLWLHRGDDAATRDEWYPMGFYQEIQPMLFRFRPPVVA